MPDRSDVTGHADPTRHTEAIGHADPTGPRRPGRCASPCRRRVVTLASAVAGVAGVMAVMAVDTARVVVVVLAARRDGWPGAALVAAAVIVPAAVASRVAAREMRAPGVGDPLTACHALQTVALALGASVLALEPDSVLVVLAVAIATLASAVGGRAHAARRRQGRSATTRWLATGPLAPVLARAGSVATALAGLAATNAVMALVAAAVLSAVATALGATRREHGALPGPLARAT